MYFSTLHMQQQAMRFVSGLNGRFKVGHHAITNRLQHQLERQLSIVGEKSTIFEVEKVKMQQQLDDAMARNEKLERKNEKLKEKTGAGKEELLAMEAEMEEICNENEDLKNDVERLKKETEALTAATKTLESDADKKAEEHRVAVTDLEAKLAAKAAEAEAAAEKLQYVRACDYMCMTDYTQVHISTMRIT